MEDKKSNNSTEQLTQYSTCTLDGENEGNASAPEVETKSMPKRIMNFCRNKFRLIFLIDAGLAIMMIVLIVLLELGIIKGKRNGFFCKDPKISYVFKGDTIRNSWMIFGCLAIPLITISIVECTLNLKEKQDTPTKHVNSRIKRILTWYRHFVVGWVILVFTCEVMKIMIGEPRPHFLDTCQPQENETCQPNNYIDTYTCTKNTGTRLGMDSTRSFPSGHSALSVYTSIFLMMYLQMRLPNRTFFLRPWLQCMISLWALTCSLTRIADNRHHWWDVLIGCVLGFISAVFVVLYPCKSFNLVCNSSNQNFFTNIENGCIEKKDKKYENNKTSIGHTEIGIPEDRELEDIPINGGR